MKLSEELRWRGQIKDRTFSEDSWLDEPKTFYVGTDCSSDSLTIGNLAVYMLARRLVKSGWKVILLVGGATSLIGDPGGKAGERELKTKEEIDRNVASITSQVKQLLGGEEFTVVNNYDWLKDVSYLEFLRDTGKHFSMSELLQREFITERIGEGGSGISYAEFSYSLIQGYDYLHLFQRYDVRLQIGGSDQWGNMLSGVPLIRKKCDAEVHALSIPLVINKSTGEKFGKSEAGAVWLDPKRTSVYQFYQFWLNVDDVSANDYLKVYTELDPARIETIITESAQNPAGRLAQKTLADTATAIVHGQDKAAAIKRVTEILFTTKRYDDLQTADYTMLEQELPSIKSAIGQNFIELLANSNLAPSKSEARRLIDSGGVYINQKQVKIDDTLASNDTVNNHAILRVGKNKHALLVLY